MREQHLDLLAVAARLRERFCFGEIAGDIDAAFIVTTWDSPVVQRLISAQGIALASIPRADAYIAHYPFLNKLVLPAGVIDLLNNRPPTDVVMLAPKGSLAVRADLHPAIQHLLLSAAVQIHSPPGIFQKAGQFPAAESIDLPLSEEAQRFYKSGRPLLQNHLPFWLATLVERLEDFPVKVVLTPRNFDYAGAATRSGSSNRYTIGVRSRNAARRPAGSAPAARSAPSSRSMRSSAQRRFTAAGRALLTPSSKGRAKFQSEGFFI